MRAKGISPIIASVLIVLVAVALVSSYTLWVNRVFGTVSEAGQEEVSQTAKKLFSDLSIEGVNRQTITIQNTGSSQLSASAIDVFIDGEPATYAADFDTLEPDELGELKLRDLWKFGHGAHHLKVGAGSFSDSMSVTVAPPPGAVMDLRFEEGSGTSTIDFTPNHNDGTLKDQNTANGDGDRPPAWTRDAAGGSFALRFDGIDDTVQVSDSDSLDVTESLTTEAWIKTDTIASGTGEVVRKVSVFELYRQGADLVFLTISGGTTRLDTATGVLNTGAMTHVVATYDGAQHRIYVDGVEKKSVAHTGNLDISTGNVFIGNDGSALGNFKGIIDEVRIYNRAYAPEELYAMRAV